VSPATEAACGRSDLRSTTEEDVGSPRMRTVPQNFCSTRTPATSVALDSSITLVSRARCEDTRAQFV
jgi:hypothetical protein